MTQLAYEKNLAEKHVIGHRFWSFAGIVLAVILAVILVVNVALFLRSYADGGLSSVDGFVSFVEQTGSMAPAIKRGDLVICRTDQAQDVVVGDVIAYYDPAGDGVSIVTHRVVALTVVGGELYFTTKGDANFTADPQPIPASSLVGVYCTCVAKIGRTAQLLSGTAGFVLFVLLPMFLLAGRDILRRCRYETAYTKEAAALQEERDILRAEKDAWQAEKTRQDAADWAT